MASDTEDAALIFAQKSAAEYLSSRFPQIPAYVVGYLVKHLVDIVYPYVKVAAHASMADGLREADLSDVACEVEANAERYLTELRAEHQRSQQRNGD